MDTRGIDSYTGAMFILERHKHNFVNTNKQTNKQTKETRMVTVIGLRRFKNSVKKMAQPGDDELNAILQETIIKLNRLINVRGK